MSTTSAAPLTAESLKLRSDASPSQGDILRYEYVELVHHPQLLELECREFTQAWHRRLPGLLCPKKFENGHLLIDCSRRIHGQDDEEAWVEDDSDTAKAVWTKILKWLEYQIEERLDADAVQGLIFLGVGPRKRCGGFVEHRHRAADRRRKRSYRSLTRSRRADG